MVDVNRRGLLALGGVSLALAGTAQAAVDAPTLNGVDPQFGIDPRSPLPASPAFNPKHICVVMIGMGTKISHSLAHYEFGSVVSEARGQGIAGEVIRHHLALGTFPKRVASGVMSQAQGDLNDLGFCFQHRIYIYLSGQNIEFGKTNNNAIRFTQLNYEENLVKSNNSFFEAKLISIFGLPKQVQYLSNVHIGDDGKILPPLTNTQIYSMNIVTLLQSGIGQPLPIIIDPVIKNTGPGGDTPRPL